MRYLFQRIVHNDLNWSAPSFGRLKSKLDAGYLAENGFAHEDWNFDKSVASDNLVHGYVYFKPKNIDDEFNVAFATYDKGGIWTLSGFYRNARFSDGSVNYPAAVVKRRAQQLLALNKKGQLGGKYKNEGLNEIVRRLGREMHDSYRWSVAPTDILVATNHLPLPSSLVPTNASRYFTRPVDISFGLFKKLMKMGGQVAGAEIPDDDLEFPEGRPRRYMHLRRERSVALVKRVKSDFLKRNGRFFCQACKFDFKEKYGHIGEDFIEAHHLVPVGKLNPDSKTKLSDLVLVCANCHRMLHRRRPWISTVKRLPDILVKK